MKPISKRARVTGLIVGGLPVLFVLFDAVIKLMSIAPVREAMDRLGYPAALAAVIGLVEALSVLLYAVPRTAPLGAVLMTGFLGGAVASHLRIGDPFWFPILVGVLLWTGLYLRDARLRALVARPTSLAV